VTIEPAHVELADAIAAKFVRGLPRGVDVDAYRGAALEALAKAAKTYDPARGWAFDGYAAQRMWFAMVDEVREQTGNSRANYAATCRGERQVITDRRGVRREVPFMTESSFDAPLTSDAEATVGDHVPAREELDGALALAEVREAISRLRPRLRFVLLARGYGYTQEEIAALLGVTGSRISQLEAVALKKIAA
jgi:RNA polymerase sigma factor (sigma-70 family)